MRAVVSRDWRVELKVTQIIYFLYLFIFLFKLFCTRQILMHEATHFFFHLSFCV